MEIHHQAEKINALAQEFEQRSVIVIVAIFVTTLTLAEQALRAREQRDGGRDGPLFPAARSGEEGTEAKG